MNDEKQLVLFFSKGTKIDGAALAYKLTTKFSILGQPAVIPFNPSNPNQPLVIFNQGIISLTVNMGDISFIYNSEYHAKLFDDIMDIISCFEELDYSFDRMGYISTIGHTKKEKEKLKNHIFKDPDMIDSEFQLSWYKKELIDSVSVNVWQREMTDTISNVDLVSIFDINTPMEEVYNINSEFLSDFIKKCDKYIEKKDKDNFNN
jgi:hypothetical protein